MDKFSVVVFKERQGKTAEPFLASRDPEVVKAIRDFISDRLRAKQSVEPARQIITEPTTRRGRNRE